MALSLQIVRCFALLWSSFFLALAIGDAVIYLMPFLVCGIICNHLDWTFIFSLLVYLWIVSILDLFLPQLPVDSLPKPPPTYLNTTIIHPHVLDSLTPPPSSLPPPPSLWPYMETIYRETIGKIPNHEVWGFIGAVVCHAGRLGANLHFVLDYAKKIIKWIKEADDIRKIVMNTPWLMNAGAVAWGFIMNRRRTILSSVFLAFLLISVSLVIFHDVFIHASRDQFSAEISNGFGVVEHGAAIVQEKMYIFGGNHNGRYLNDLQEILDLRTTTWSKVEMKAAVETLESPSPTCLAPCADHYLNLLCVAGHTKDPAESVIVLEFDKQTWTWLKLKTNGKIPVSRGGQMVTLVGPSLVMFGREDAKRSLLNDLHILALETMTWDEIDAMAENVAAVHAERYLLIFGGGSHATCFNDLHALDLKSMECSKPKQQGDVPTAQAGHAGATVGENRFIAGGGDNKTRVSETMVLYMSTLVRSVVTTVKGRVPISSEELQSIRSQLAAEQSWCSNLR